MLAQLSRFPSYDVDLFSPEALRSPFGHYRALRDLGPVVRLSDPDVYVLSRFADVRAALQSPDVLINGAGVGFSDVANTPGSPNLIQTDGDRHRRMRAEVIRPILPGSLKQHRPFLRTLIGERVKSLVGRGRFDAMTEIARFLPTEAISVLVGLPEDGRASMLDWAAAVFNSIGPEREGSQHDFKVLGGWRTYLAGLDWEHIREGS